jgi:hypothetical protein
MFDLKDSICPLCGRPCERPTNYTYRCTMLSDHFFTAQIERDYLYILRIRLDNICFLSCYDTDVTYVWKDDNLGLPSKFSPVEAKIKITPAIIVTDFNRDKLKNKLKLIINFS